MAAFVGGGFTPHSVSPALGRGGAEGRVVVLTNSPQQHTTSPRTATFPPSLPSTQLSLISSTPYRDAVSPRITSASPEASPPRGSSFSTPPPGTQLALSLALPAGPGTRGLTCPVHGCGQTHSNQGRGEAFYFRTFKRHFSSHLPTLIRDQTHAPVEWLQSHGCVQCGGCFNVFRSLTNHRCIHATSGDSLSRTPGTMGPGAAVRAFSNVNMRGRGASSRQSRARAAPGTGGAEAGALKAFEVSAAEWIVEQRGVRTFQSMPPGCASPFFAALLVPLHKINNAQSESERVQGWNLLHLLPAMVMGSCGGKQLNARKVSQTIKRRATSFIRGDWDELLSEYIKNNPKRAGGRGGAAGGAVPADDSTAAQELRSWKQILKLAKQGQFSKAAARMVQSGRMIVNADVINKLRSKHPARAFPINPDEWTTRDLEPVEKISFEWDTVAKALQAAPNGSAAGLSGFRQEWLKPLTFRNHLEDVEVRTQLVTFFTTVANGEVPQVIVPLMSMCQLIAIPKPADPLDPRPIALGETFLKTTDRCILQLHKSDASEMMRRVNQLGSSIPGGVEASAHAIRTLHLADPENITLSLDLMNAFNEMSRLAICRAIKRHYPHLLPYVKMILNDPSALFILDENGEFVLINSSEGVKQGFPLSGFLFCLVLYDLLLDMKESCPEAVTLAIADDINITGKPEFVYQVFRKFVDSVPSTGLTLQIHKIKAFTAAATKPPPPVGFSWREQGDVAAPDSILFADGIRVGGIPIGSPAYVADTLEEMMGDTRLLGEKIIQLAKLDGGTQCAFLTLKHCLLPKVNHLARGMPPSDPNLRRALVEHDRIVSHTLQGIFPGAPLDQVPVLHQISLPTRLGGLGLRPQIDIAPLAYVASWALCGEILYSIDPIRRILRSNNGQWFDIFESASADAYALTGEDIGDLEGLCSAAQKGVQSKLVAAFEDKISEALMCTTTRQMTPFHWARVASASVPGSLDWLNAVPYAPEYTLDNASYLAAFCWTLGLPQPILENIRTCAAGHQDIDNLGIHFMNRNCGGSSAVTDNAGNWRQIRHDITVRTIAKCANELGIRTTLEPGNLAGLRAGSRADIRLYGYPDANCDTLLDLVISSPYTSNLSLRVASASAVQGATALMAERGKDSDYESLDTNNGGIQFIPLAYDSFGAAAPKASNFLQGLAENMAIKITSVDSGPSYDRAFRSILSKWRKRISVVIQRENVKCIFVGASRSPDAPSLAEDHLTEYLLDPRPIQSLIDRRG
jgi:hypothetical protein